MTDPIATPSTDTDAFGVDHGIIDVEFIEKKARFHLGRVLAIGVIGGFVFALLFFMVMVLWERSYGVVLIVSSAVGLLLLVAWFFRKNGRDETNRMAEFCKAYQDSETPHVVTGMISDFNLSGDYLGTAPLVDGLTRMQRFGSVVRCAPPESRVALRPFSVPFEPLVLDETDEATAALMEGLDKAPGEPTDGSETHSRISPASSAYRLVGRALRFEGRLGVWMGRLLWLLILIFLFAVDSTTSFLVVLGITSLHIVDRLTAEIYWLVSPGALVIRGGRRLSWKASLRRYMRSEAVLVVHQIGEDMWHVAVGDGESIYARRCTGGEMDLLLRCWLSPVAPLPLEKYSDFGDSA